jgi:hypothetical protein
MRLLSQTPACEYISGLRNRVRGAPGSPKTTNWPTSSAELVFRYGRGQGANQIVQHDGRQVLRIAPSVRKDFDGSTVEAVDGALGDVPPGSLPTDDGS